IWMVFALALIAMVACTMSPEAAPGPTHDPHIPARLAGSYMRPAVNGWLFVHLQGTPSDIGFQNGYWLAPRIEDLEKVVALEQQHNNHKDWNFLRNAAKEMMWPHIEPEYRQELQGIADGVDAHGGHMDVWDVVAVNALEAWGYYIPAWNKLHPEANSTAPAPAAVGDHCSAFVATGAWTKDGKIVMAHNNWSPYMEGSRWNIIYDVVPQHGYQFMMDGLPGVIHSADDFGVNSDGLMITETTISDFHGYDFNGIPEFVRARKAMQYAGSIAQYAAIMEKGNNGGYANDWLVGDRKTNEIASLELGLKNVTLKTSKDGFFVSSNFPINPKLTREETTFDINNPGLSANARHTRWLQLMAQYKGKIDVAAAEKFEADHYDVILKKINPDQRTLCGHEDLDTNAADSHPSGAVQAKAIDSDMAARMSFMAHLGHAGGISFYAAPYLKTHPKQAWQAPELRDMPAFPWTAFTAAKGNN
ncbi:MAG: C45 family autoproteolytic acyltransferase/hydrolase, partial [Terriglobales bacterium]